MKWFYNLKISSKLIIGFVIVAMIAGVVGITGIINIKTIDSEDTELYKLNTVPLVYLEEVAVALLNKDLEALEMTKGEFKVKSNIDKMRV